MKTQHLFIFIITVFSFKTTFSQENKIINAYQKSIAAFANIDLCDPFEGPAYLVKRMENGSLDRLVQVTPAQEAQLGLSIFQQSQADYVVNNPTDLKKLKGIVKKLAAASSDPNRVYHTYIIKSDQINAYSTIGGYIYVTTALLDFVGSDDEMAFILGHEMGHIIDQHVTRKQKKIALLSFVGQKMNLERFSKVALNVNLTLSAPFDQIDEYDADATGFALIKKAGYRQTGFNDFFSKLEKFEKNDLLSRFTSTHPSSANRKKCLNKMVNK